MLVGDCVYLPQRLHEWTVASLRGGDRLLHHRKELESNQPAEHLVSSFEQEVEICALERHHLRDLRTYVLVEW